MNRKPMTWTMAALLFLFMVTFEIGLNMAFMPALRPQIGSIHSLYWQVGIPADLAANAILVMAARMTYNRLLKNAV